MRKRYVIEIDEEKGEYSIRTLDAAKADELKEAELRGYEQCKRFFEENVIPEKYVSRSALQGQYINVNDMDVYLKDAEKRGQDEAWNMARMITAASVGDSDMLANVFPGNKSADDVLRNHTYGMAMEKYATWERGKNKEKFSVGDVVTLRNPDGKNLVLVVTRVFDDLYFDSIDAFGKVHAGYDVQNFKKTGETCTDLLGFFIKRR